MEILTHRLILEEIIWDDLEDIHYLHSFYEVDEFNTIGIPKDIEETRNNVYPFIEEKGNPQRKYTWIVKIRDSGIFIGLAGISLSHDKFKIGEIFYKLLPGYWGKGYATEISRKIIDVGFRNFSLHRIEAGCAKENTRSISVLEKCGMIREGILRKILPIRGKWIDSYKYSIIEDEYEKA
jgi:RimJ/RimL family protein N-acetyltransferase